MRRQRAAAARSPPPAPITGSSEARGRRRSARPLRLSGVRQPHAPGGARMLRRYMIGQVRFSTGAPSPGRRRRRARARACARRQARARQGHSRTTTFIHAVLRFPATRSASDLSGVSLSEHRPSESGSARHLHRSRGGSSGSQSRGARNWRPRRPLAAPQQRPSCVHPSGARRTTW